MNVAIIFAGGAGQRMNTRTLPKQFLELHGKPILIYTLENFQRHEQIDAIVLICLEGWIAYCQELLERYRITKVKVIVPGGDTGQASICRGVEKAHELYPEDTVILIHDGVRPLILPETICSVIASVQLRGSAITVAPATETIAIQSDDGCVGKIIDRSQCQMAKAPQAFFLGDIWQAHQEAKQDRLLNFIDSASLMQHYGHSLYTVEGPAENIKITTPSDFYIFRAMIDARENSQIFG